MAAAIGNKAPARGRISSVEGGHVCGEQGAEGPRRMEIDVVKGTRVQLETFDILPSVSGNQVLQYNARSALPISQLIPWCCAGRRQGDKSAPKG